MPYARVYTVGQTTENQVREIEAAGFKVEPRRVVTETISGSSAIDQRPGFRGLLARLERDDVLIVTKMDRLGRDAIDVAQTVAKLGNMGLRVHCLALGGVDLTSAAGKMTMGVINSVAQFERDLLIERTHSGQLAAVADVRRRSRAVASDARALEWVRIIAGWAPWAAPMARDRRGARSGFRINLLFTVRSRASMPLWNRRPAAFRHPGQLFGRPAGFMVADADGLELAYVYAQGEHPGANAAGLTLDEPAADRGGDRAAAGADWTAARHDNLMRSDLIALQRAEQIAEWIGLTGA